MNFEDNSLGWFNMAIKDSIANHNIPNAIYIAER